MELAILGAVVYLKFFRRWANHPLKQSKLWIQGKPRLSTSVSTDYPVAIMLFSQLFLWVQIRTVGWLSLKVNLYREGILSMSRWSSFDNNYWTCWWTKPTETPWTNYENWDLHCFIRLFMPMTPWTSGLVCRLLQTPEMILCKRMCRFSGNRHVTDYWHWHSSSGRFINSQIGILYY